MRAAVVPVQQVKEVEYLAVPVRHHVSGKFGFGVGFPVLHYDSFSLFSKQEVGKWARVGDNFGVQGVVQSNAGVGLGACQARGRHVALGQALQRDLYHCDQLARAIGTGVRVLGDDWERGYGTLEWRGVVPERVLPWYALLHEPGRGATRGVGVETGAASLASWRVDETGVTLVLDVRCGGLGVQLGARRLHAATVHELSSRPGESLFAFALRFCSLLCPNPRLPAQPVYGGNDWYSRYGNITAETVGSDAAVIRELSPAGDNLPSYVIDVGWFPADEHEADLFDRSNNGFLDMPGLANEIQSSGVKPGIWMRPLQTTKDAPQFWCFGPEHPLANVPGVYLDPSVPEVLEHVRKDIARIVDWGYRVIKHDFSTYDILGRWGRDMGLAMTLGVTSGDWAFADRTRTTAEIITDFYSTIQAAAGEAQVIGCNTIGHLAAGHFEMQRTGDDTSGYRWERTRIMGVNTVAFRMSQHGTFFCADADCVGLRSEIPWEYNRAWLELLGRSSERHSKPPSRWLRSRWNPLSRWTEWIRYPRASGVSEARRAKRRPATDVRFPDRRLRARRNWERRKSGELCRPHICMGSMQCFIRSECNGRKVRS